MRTSLGVVTISYNFLRKIVLQRHLIWNFIIRDLKSRYIGSFMGFFWSVIHPLVLLLSYTFVFSIVFQIKPKLGQIDNFAVFLFCGILPWLYFQDTLIRSCNCVVDHSHLIRKTLFASEILPVTLVLSNLVTHLVGFAILLVVLLYMNTIGWAALLVPIYLILLMVLSLGLGWLAAALQVFLRDTAQILSVIMVFWFWFTPIFYQVEMVPKAFRPWMRFNPLTHMVEGYRCLLLENRLPDAQSLLWLVAWAMGAFVVGGFVFRNTKREFVDVL
ncbi:ABC transporter permease [Acidobacteria bacterium AH-259-O06]|nr:ABC transporter permease [Acidobacteria bacterium AH-259-O06]